MSATIDNVTMDLSSLIGEFKTGAANEKIPFSDSVEYLLENFTFLHGSDCVWDHAKWRMMKFSHLSLSAPNASKIWKTMPERRMSDIDDVVFDPENKQEGKINLFKGLESRPLEGDCQPILDLLLMLCNGDELLYDWMLKWAAYPLQHVGAKMATAIIMRGPGGTGKNLFWEDCIRDIYGRYGKTIGQREIESPYNQWVSASLFIVADEILTRRDKWDLKGLLKSLVTGKTIAIREVYLPMRIERNHANLVFLSNENVPLPIDEDDRRHTVIEPRTVLSKAFYKELADFIANGGREAFHHYMLNLDLEDFNPHTPPHDTEARDELKRASMLSHQAFVIEWLSESADFPLCAVPRSTLYKAYRVWCYKNGEKSATAEQLGKALNGKVRCEKPRNQHGKQVRCYIPAGMEVNWLQADDLENDIDDELLKCSRRKL